MGKGGNGKIGINLNYSDSHPQNTTKVIQLSIIPVLIRVYQKNLGQVFFNVIIRLD